LNTLHKYINFVFKKKKQQQTSVKIQKHQKCFKNKF